MRAAFPPSAASPAHGLGSGHAGAGRPTRPGVAPLGPLWATVAAALLGAAAALLAGPTSAALAARPEPAIDGAPVAVMGLSLAMTPRQVVDVLRPQALRLRRHRHPCPAAPTARCTDLIRARTPAGRLAVRFADTPPGVAAGPALVWRIRLTIDGTGPMAPAQLRAAAAHDGPPTRPARQLWCPGVAPGAPCPPDRPRLRLIRRPDGASILSLSDPGLRDRLARDSAAAMRSAGVRSHHGSPPAG